MKRKWFVRDQSCNCLKFTSNAFSVAEAMISLLIGSIILGLFAPMISKQLKHNNMSDVQAQVLNRKIDELRTLIPTGAIMYFDLPTCPSGWSALSVTHPDSKNAFIRNIDGSGRAMGSYQGSALPNLRGYMVGAIRGWHHYYASSEPTSAHGVFEDTWISELQLPASGSRGKGCDVKGMPACIDPVYSIVFDASRSSEIYKDNVNEVVPNNVVFLACRKD